MERVLTFDQPAASISADLRARRRALGRPLAVLDAQIAAIAAVGGCGVATRNVSDFASCGLEVINPFET